jgi:hypothetical protein
MMMRTLLLTLAFCLTTSVVFSQYSDPNISKPATGYGSDGVHPVGVVSFQNPNFQGKKIEIYYPKDVKTKVPTLFFCHGYGGNNPKHIRGLLRFVASKGYAMVFVPYQTVKVTIDDRYNNLLEGFRKAARDYPFIIDTTRVGFMGHSFGGGALFGVANKCFKENNWGSNGRFLFSMAPWYSFNISQDDLKSFPKDTKLISEVFDDDDTNDHRMAIDIFKSINIPDSEKDFILLKSSVVNGHNYEADHRVPSTSKAQNALDYYAIYRLLDALFDYTFTGNPAAKDVALGNGSKNQVEMPGGLTNLVVTDNPAATHPESNYKFRWSRFQNPRMSQVRSK